MKETDFYLEISEKFRQYLLLYLPNNSQIEFSYNKILPKMVQEIESKFKCQSNISKKYIPALHLDILFGIKIPNKEIKFILFEVKFLNQLALAGFSQLVGYLQVAKEIKFGVLLLICKNPNINPLSNEFSDILLMKELPMKWTMCVPTQYDFETGICNFIPNNGIEWVNTTEVNGIYSFEDLVAKIIFS